MDFEKAPEWEQALGLLGEVYSLTIGLTGEEERYLATCLRETAMAVATAVAHGAKGGSLTEEGKERVFTQLVSLIACLEMAIKLSLGSREANSDLLVSVRNFARQLENK